MDELLNANGDKLRLFAVWCVRRVQHLITNDRNLNVLNIAERHAKGEATDDELKEAYMEAVRKTVIKDWWLHRADDAARFTALPDSLQAAYSASESASGAIATEAFDQHTEPEDWKARKNEEWDIHYAVIDHIIGRELRMFAVQCARRVQHLIKNKESLHAIDVAERFANDEATHEELTEACNEALSAIERLNGEYHDADSAAIYTVCEHSLEAALFGSGCAARAIAFEIDGCKQGKNRSPRWTTAHDKEVAAQRAMLKKILEGETK